MQCSKLGTFLPVPFFSDSLVIFSFSYFDIKSCYVVQAVLEFTVFSKEFLWICCKNIVCNTWLLVCDMSLIIYCWILFAMKFTSLWGISPIVFFLNTVILFYVSIIFTSLNKSGNTYFTLVQGKDCRVSWSLWNVSLYYVAQANLYYVAQANHELLSPHRSLQSLRVQAFLYTQKGIFLLHFLCMLLSQLPFQILCWYLIA